MSLWIAFAALLLITVIIVIWPLLRQKTSGQTNHNALVYQDQLGEIDRDVERGLLSSTEAGALKLEINRRLEKTQEENALKVGAASRSNGFLFSVMIAILIILPLASLGLYRHLGSPEKPDQPFAERKSNSPAQAANAEMTRLVNALKNRMAENPDKIEGWLLLGRSLVSLERYDDASAAFKQAFQIDPTRAEIAASVAETGFMAANGIFTPDVRRYFQTAQKLNPQEHKALYYLGVDLAGQKKYGKAIQNWVDLIEISPVGAPWLDTVRRQLVEAAAAGSLEISDFKPRFKAAPKPAGTQLAAPEPGPGPTQADVRDAQKLSGNDRQAFIRSMVARLAERLASEPDDIDGWRRLARAYKVLGETEKAAETESRIRNLTK